MENISIRTVCAADAEAILAIYAPYVRNTAITFEYDVPTVDEFRARIENTLRKYPYLAAQADGRILGYAYAGPFKARAAYDWSVELSIYLAPEAQGKGIGRKLYAALEDALRKMGILNLYACIAYPEVEDEYLTKASEGFHAHLGFVKTGEFHRCGFKFGRWYNMIWMEKIIGEGTSAQQPVIPYPEI